MSTSTHYPSQLLEADGHDGHAKVAPGEIAVGVVIGRASEYFDFFVFGIACVLVFPQVFFPFEARLEGTLWSFVIFSFAFIVRPVGTALSMAVQRRWGRATKLTLALFVLGTATVGMAFLPSYNDIGIHAITLLALFRCLQGLAFGGSWDGLPSLLALRTAGEERLVRHDGPVRGSGRLSGRQRAVSLSIADPERGGFPRLGLALPVFRGVCH
ncbi:transporter, major facilitator domain protein [Bordetella holmesii CDC-H635-BH]|uniref:Transporter, major facilitator domain protein n=1 Tax=Bordetella holmesii CDC-H585-BH TaxID=1331206 RepID=A0A158M550_9BORD|nr:transporter, major facilitator domain protein [Bordetella holmesii CDC-H809-BH]KAK89053.1 transporter, major facilitator domain protein [Bordetella holmesii H620]KAK96005.1 transporter, major facilitator domain protein [Bordetella holmesii CDC-H585-BH]KAL01824.1 transporter, major facilitator domain protein [Bordetella holmesii CDC-H635-BH]KCV00562.1 transporter, major facilitator domain protein [Bordetella holmesii CDC-H629-BH]KCV06499.1 transporter, major facilitator domain protein [Borde